MEQHVVTLEQLQVTQSNELATAAYSMTLEEKRLLLLVISRMRRNDEYLKCYKFPVKEVLNFVGLHQNKDAYQRLRETTKRLLSRVVDIETDHESGYKQFQWMSYARYISSEESESGFAELELQVHSMMKPFLLDLKDRFSSIPFADVAQLPSFHSVRMFEILWTQSHKGTRPKIYMNLNTLKKTLGVEKSYANFAHFRQRILDKAKRDFVEKTPIIMNYEAKKQGRKVVGIWFTITPNERSIQLGLNLPFNMTVTELPPYAEKNLKREYALLLERMIDIFGFKEDRAKKLLAENDIEQISRNLDYAEAKYKSGTVKRLTAYAIKAIVQNYHSKDTIASPADQISQTPEDIYNDSRVKFVGDLITELGYQELAEEFEPHLLEQCKNNKFLASQFKIIENDVKALRQNSVIYSNFRTFIIQNYAPFYMHNFEKWKEHQAS